MGLRILGHGLGGLQGSQLLVWVPSLGLRARRGDWQFSEFVEPGCPKAKQRMRLRLGVQKQVVQLAGHVGSTLR